jgi:isochorismate synthase EntC
LLRCFKSRFSQQEQLREPLRLELWKSSRSLSLFGGGPYAGAVGYFSFNGNADFAITIRTLIASGRRAYIQVGAGIVADSVPEREWLETEHKASALLEALQRASEGEP